MQRYGILGVFILILSLTSSFIINQRKNTAIKTLHLSPKKIQNTKLFARKNQNSNKDALIQIDPVRFVGYNLLAISLAIGANFLGCTSWLMSHSDPQLFRSLKLDQLYPIDGLRRVVDLEDKYEFVFPAQWTMDPRVLLYNTRSREMPQPLQRIREDSGIVPDTAYGPPKEDFTENVSVVKSRVLPGFSLAGTLGQPQEAAQKILDTIIAPPGSGKIATLVRVSERGAANTVSNAYEIEYTLQLPGFKQGDTLGRRHVISVITARGNTLFTFTATATEEQWQRDSESLLLSAKSFQIQ